MVLLHVKQKDDRQFLFEAPAKECVDTVIRELVLINNLQLRILGLKEESKRLVLHGPSKHPDDDEDSDDEGKKIQKYRGPHYNKDPHSRRTGEACDPETSKQITKAVEDAIALVSKENALEKINVTADKLKEAINVIRGAVMICYPQGLPKWDVVQQVITGIFSPKETLDPDTAHLWWAGKELLRDKCLKDYVGKNEKTKIVAKLRSQGQSCPEREPPIDADTHKAMMAHYYKQQEQLKRMAEDEDDAYMNAQWANPRSLKSQLHGMSCNMQFK